MPLITTRVVILQTHRYSDTSKILRLMTREHGPRSAIARGALRPKGRFGGLLEPFAEGTATLYVKENRELHSLSGFDLLRARQALAVDLDRFAGASVLSELVLRLAPEHRDLPLYRALVAGLDHLLEVTRREVPATSLLHIWHLVRLLGFRPELATCLACERPIPVDSEVWFDFPAGGLRCPRCGRSGQRLSPAEAHTLRRLVSGEGDLPSDVAGQGTLLAQFVRYHLAEGTRLRSLSFLQRLG
ncbi:MAG: DNA repair protein RecO [Gemmatimonadota bacterium]